MRSVLRNSALIVAMMASASCDQILVEQPQPNGLAGVYTLSPEAVDFLKLRKQYRVIPDASIELRSDGTLLVHNLPDCLLNGFGHSGGKFLSGHGRWKVEKAFVGYGLVLEIYPGDTLPAGIYAGPWIAIRRRSPPYELEKSVGDPDSGERIRYHRSSV